MEAEFGVIVGRFQVPYLHKAHCALIEKVQSKHERVIVFLGVARPKCTVRNPLDVFTREQMIKQTFPNVVVSHIVDERENAIWVKKLDESISGLTTKGKVVLYGGRDSFINIYQSCGGKYPTCELDEVNQVSGTENRMIASRKPIPSNEFRSGIIYATQLRYPVSYQTVDVACLSEDNTEILLGRKPNESLWRLIGGFVDVKDESLEAAARREFAEEAGGSCTDPIYVKSYRIDDWRYRSEVDKLMTTLFECHVQFGRLTPGDDIEQLKWVDLKSLNLNDVVEFHRIMIKDIQNRY